LVIYSIGKFEGPKLDRKIITTNPALAILWLNFFSVTFSDIGRTEFDVIMPLVMGC